MTSRLETALSYAAVAAGIFVVRLIIGHRSRDIKGLQIFSTADTRTQIWQHNGMNFVRSPVFARFHVVHESLSGRALGSVRQQA